MKLIVFFVVLSTAMSAYAKSPLLVKSSESGQLDGRREVCEVFTDEIVITRSYREINVVQRLNLSVSNEVNNYIRTAAKEGIYFYNNDLCPPTSTYIYAELSKNSETERVILFSTGGCGIRKQIRQGVASNTLMEIVNSYCPQTFKIE
jgi:hypothetical protein